MVLAIAALVFVLASGGGGDEEWRAKGNAHINLNAAIGSTNGVRPDNRAGTAPAAVKVAEPRRPPPSRPAATCA